MNFGLFIKASQVTIGLNAIVVLTPMTLLFFFLIRTGQKGFSKQDMMEGCE